MVTQMQTETVLGENLALAPAGSAGGPQIGTLERLPKWANLIPMVVQWLWLSLRHGSFTLPSAANPAIVCGGLVGEGKLEYFDAMGPVAKAATAATTFIDNAGAATCSSAIAAMQAAGIAFPIIAKPNIGWCGFGVRLIRNAEELAVYLSRFPRGERIVLQRYVTFEGEAGLFYVRDPGAVNGCVTGILLRTFPRVVGDGHSSIAQLMERNGRLRRLGRDGLSEPCCDTSRVPHSGEIVRVSTIGSTRVGGLYENASSAITPEIDSAVNAIARDMPDFHVGRFDVRYESMGALREGRFLIIEVNGAGSEAVHAWDPHLTLRQAYAIVFEKQRRIFEIGAAMRRRGFMPASLGEMVRLFLRQQRLIRRYPPSN
jgi:hypothetical protein